MTRWTIDTNVPVVANGRDLVHPPSLECQKAAICFLDRVLKERQSIVLDEEGKIVEEYRRHLRPGGQPGVSDRFYQRVLLDWDCCERIPLPKRRDGQYADLPQALIDDQFDPDDRKFAALAKRERIPVVNATDSDWLHAHTLLKKNGIRVKFLCGCDPASWFTA